MEWFKFYGGAYLSDPKMLMLTACERSCWVTLLSYASVAEDGGRVKYLTEQQLMIAASVSPMDEEWKKTVGVLEKFEKLGMIDVSDGTVTIKNWGKRQESYLTGAERQKRYREKRKSNAIVTEVSNESNARIEENRIDTGVAIAPLKYTIKENTGDDLERVQKSKPKYLHSKEVFSWFPNPEPSWAIDTTQLKHAELLWARGETKVKGALRFAAKLKGIEYAPQVSTPTDLERKWGKLADYKL